MAILALELIFEKIGIRKLCAEILDYNITSLKFHERLGFKKEGRFVGHVVKNDQYIDMIPMALFSDKWVAVKEKLLLRLRRDL